MQLPRSGKYASDKKVATNTSEHGNVVRFYFLDKKIFGNNEALGGKWKIAHSSGSLLLI